MSVLIKGMEMPKTCEACDFCQWSNFHQTAVCNRCDYKPVCMDCGTDYRRGRASFCPLVEIPTPHGDLVDRDELLAEYDRQHKGLAGGARRIMEDAPTIIEAEGSEE